MHVSTLACSCLNILQVATLLLEGADIFPVLFHSLYLMTAARECHCSRAGKPELS